jgi:hypothetical protein
VRSLSQDDQTHQTGIAVEIYGAGGKLPLTLLNFSQKGYGISPARAFGINVIAV